MKNKTEKKQTRVLRYSDNELELLNSIFAGRMELLLLVRNFLLGGELTADEMNQISFGPDVMYVIKKTYLPELEFTAPLGQLVDLWSNIDTKTKDVDGAWLEMASREIMVDYIKARFQDWEYKTNNAEFLKLFYDPKKKKEQAFLDLSARNTIVAHVEFQTGQLWILSGEKKETIEEISKRLYQNSNK